ncbi:MAG TPA: hypothetical protein PLR48_05645 [Bacillota bacterium]|nr:hypothetical protein [Bacillota bacterium]
MAKTYATTPRAQVDSTAKKKAARVLEKIGINVSEAGKGSLYYEKGHCEGCR